MGDLKDTHYLDTIWFNFELPEFERIEPCGRYVAIHEHKFSEADHGAMVFNLMTQLHQFEIITLGLESLMGFIGTPSSRGR